MNEFDFLITNFGRSAAAVLSLTPDQIIDGANSSHIALWRVWAYVEAFGRASEFGRAQEWANTAFEYAQQHREAAGPIWHAEATASVGHFLFRLGEVGNAAEAFHTATACWHDLAEAFPDVINDSRMPEAQSLLQEIKGMVRALDLHGEVFPPDVVSDSDQSSDLLGMWFAGRLCKRYPAVATGLMRTLTAIGQIDDARAVYSHLKGWLDRTTQLHPDFEYTLRSESWSAAMALGDLELATDNVDASADRFGDAVALYYQNVRDYNELGFLIRAMFNQANSWVRMARYREARNVYSLIISDFSLLGDEEAVLRVRYADLFARWKESPDQTIEQELRELIEDYEEYVSEQRDRSNWHVHKVNLVQAYTLMLSQLAHAEPAGIERLGETLNLIEAMRQPHELSGSAHLLKACLPGSSPTNWITKLSC